LSVEVANVTFRAPPVDQRSSWKKPTRFSGFSGLTSTQGSVSELMKARPLWFSSHDASVSGRPLSSETLNSELKNVVNVA
jgi:hypothetical protein